ncbi:MAG: histidine phosphatase family protein [Bacteroidales bacterium]
MKTTIYLVRHGETEWNTERRYQGSGDSPLTKRGIEQAYLLKEYLKKIKFDFVLSSPSNRAFHTAAIASGHDPDKIIIIKELQEINLGKWEGKLYDEMQKENPFLYHAFWKAPHLFISEGCESFTALTLRTFKAFSAIIEKFSGKTILIVSHAAALMSILNKIENRPLERFWEKMLKQTSVSIVEIDNNKFSVLEYGSIPHLLETKN